MLIFNSLWSTNVSGLHAVFMRPLEHPPPPGLLVRWAPVVPGVCLHGERQCAGTGVLCLCVVYVSKERQRTGDVGRGVSNEGRR